MIFKKKIIIIIKKKNMPHRKKKRVCVATQPESNKGTIPPPKKKKNNIHKHHNKHGASNFLRISHLMCFQTHVYVRVYKGSFVHVQTPGVNAFLCTNMFAKYVMHPKTYNDILNKKK
jgi:hypothetical protein